MAAADLKIVVGAQIDKSASQIREDLKGVQEKFDKRPLKIRIGANVTDSKQQISEDLKSVKEKYDKNPLKIKIGIDGSSVSKSIKSALPQIKKELNQALSNAVPIQVNIKPQQNNSQGQGKNALDSRKQGLNDSVDGLERYLQKFPKLRQQFQQSIADIRSEIASLSSVNAAKYITKDINRIETEVNRLNKVKDELTFNLDTFKAEFNSVNGKSSGASKNQITTQIQDMETAINNLTNTNQIPALKKQFADLNKELKDIDTSKFNEMDKDIKALQNRKEQFGLTTEDLTNLNEAGKILAKIQSADFKKLSYSDQTAEVDKLYAALDKVQGKLKDVSSFETLQRSTASVESSIAKLTRRLTDFAEKYKKLENFPELQHQYDNIMKSLTAPGQKTQSDFINLKRDVEEFEAAARRAGVTTKSLGEWLGEAYQKFGGWALVTSSMMNAVHVLEQMVVSVRNLDTAMTELKKVTNETDSAYSQFFQRASAQSKEIGATMSNYINSTADFARLGYSLADAEELAKTTAVYYNVADGMESIDEATQSVISTMKAFGMDVKDSIDIVDLFNHTSNNFAISSAGIGEAMQRSASALREAGSTIEESVALITAANSVIQDPMKVGNSLKTLSLRMRGAKVDLEEAGLATDGMAESTSKLRKEILALTGQKVDIMVDEDTFKSPFKMLEELSKVWGSMTDINKAAALELLGGKQQANILASLITNFQTAKDVMEEAGNAAGSAMEENERQLNSINGKITQFQTNFESLSATVMDSELIKGTIDFGSGFLHGLDTLMQNLGTLPTLLSAVAGGFAGIKAIGKINCPLTPRKQGVGCLLNGIEIETIKLLGMAKTLSPFGSRKTETRIGMVYAEIKAA